MAFAFGKLVFILLRPSNLLLLLGLIGLSGLWRRPRAWAKGLLALSLGLMLLVTLLPVGDWLMAPLEDRFPRPADYPARVDGVVVLGGGVLSDITAARGTPTFYDTGERYMALLELARRYPDAKVLFTGGVGRLEGGVPPETDTIRLLLRQHGIPEGRVLLDDKARTTRENALYAEALGQPRPGESWLLVTSAGHMPRAMGCFRAVGWEPTPWLVDYRTTGPFQPGWGSQLTEGLYQLDEAAYEWLGLVYYRLLGWTPALFPGPAA
jgi:uncharacterized SAM-binding protein YcdF (DUF218 family)